MPVVNFSNFAERTSGLLNSDYIIGYDPTGPTEFRTNVGNLLSGGAASEHTQYSFVLAHGNQVGVVAANTYYFGQQWDRNFEGATSNASVVYPASNGIIKYASIQTYINGTPQVITDSASNIYSIENSAGTSTPITTFYPLSTKSFGNLYTVSPAVQVKPGDKLYIKFVPAVTNAAISLRTVINLFIF